MRGARRGCRHEGPDRRGKPRGRRQPLHLDPARGRASHAEHPQKYGKGRLMSDNRSKSSTKLLIVEDDVGLQRQLRWAYEDYQVLVAGDRAQAVEILRAEEPDVVTLDLGLPPDPDGTAKSEEHTSELQSLMRT